MSDSKILSLFSNTYIGFKKTIGGMPTEISTKYNGKGKENIYSS